MVMEKYLYSQILITNITRCPILMVKVWEKLKENILNL